ncbi:aspartate/glutamate racemase family protein [Marinobacterium lutimaris]|uniref:Allantoin racemase n=1 Tax=Marinobacterium lutimaris TaxID=568106 RepID=A0A1H5V8F0_9GAMM|nr:aspartate/glutamate racemase family protein [Marinobacterium lutimaris]SEF83672.1 allantoin racemase [Marinobacterium lutimaris]
MKDRSTTNAPSLKRILVINPNTNYRISARVQKESEKILGANTRITVMNPDTGPLSIETLEHRNEAVPKTIALAQASLDQNYDACALACFDDIGLHEIRSFAGVPVIGPFEASITAARSVAKRFTIVTTVHSAVPGINELIRHYGVSDICTVRAAGIGVAQAALGGEATQALIEQAITDATELDKAEAIILGSGGLTGSAPMLAKKFGIPVIDAILAAVKIAEGLAGIPSISRKGLVQPSTH